MQPTSGEQAVIEVVTVGDAARAWLRSGSTVMAEEIRVGSRYFARVRGAEVVLGFDRWISFDLSDPAEADAARRIGPGMLDLVAGDAPEGYEVVRSPVARPPVIEPVPDGRHVPIRSVPEAVRAAG